MTSFRWTLVALGLFTCCAMQIDPAWGQGEQPPDQDGVEVLTRGPVHEAYAEPVSARPRLGPVISRQPPEPIEELPPDQKPEGDNVQWIPGYWSFDDDRQDFIWVSGLWRLPPPERQWVPGRWTQSASNWQWVPGFWTVTAQGNVEYLPPPPEPVDAGPSVPAPDADSVYVPGCWVYRTNRYVWRPGYWYGCRPGWIWIPAHYVWTPCGYVFVDGYWDYPLRSRGLLFAPVHVQRVVVVRPGWRYQPRFVVYDDCFHGALFVRADHGHYYFGDYFEPRYSRIGFTAWIDVRPSRYSYDPLFSYYRYEYRERRDWEVSIRQVYVGRYRGEVARPPRTLVQQNTIINQINVVNNTTNVTNVNNVKVNQINQVAMVAPVTKVDSNKVAKLQTITPERRQEEVKAARQMREVSTQRGQSEARLLAQGPPPSKPTDAPRVLKYDLPRQPEGGKTTTPARTPPPPPSKPEIKAVPVPASKPLAASATKPAVTGGKPEGTTTTPPAAPGKPDLKPAPITPAAKTAQQVKPAVAPAPAVKPGPTTPPPVNPAPAAKPLPAPAKPPVPTKPATTQPAPAAKPLPAPAKPPVPAKPATTPPAPATKFIPAKPQGQGKPIPVPAKQDFKPLPPPPGNAGAGLPVAKPAVRPTPPRTDTKPAAKPSPKLQPDTTEKKNKK